MHRNLKTKFAALLAFISLLASAQGLLAEGKLSPRQFSEEYFAVATKKYPKLKLKRIDDLGFQLQGPPADGAKVFLDNAYGEYKQSPRDLREILERYVSILDGLEKTFEKVRRTEDIVPLFRSMHYVKSSSIATGQALEDHEKHLFYREVVPGLALVFAYDLPKGVKLINNEDFKELKLSEQEVLSLARKNLKRIIGDQISFQKSEHLVIVRVDGMFESSLLALTDLWNIKNFPVRGNIVAFVPARNVLIVTGSENISGLDVGAEIERKIFSESPRSIYPAPLVLLNGKWESFVIE